MKQLWEENQILIGLNLIIPRLQLPIQKIGRNLVFCLKVPSTLEKSIDIGLKNNPDYVQTLIQFENAKFDIRKSNLNFTPEFSVTGSVGKALDSSRSVERKDTYSVTAEVTVPIFNKGHNVLNLEKSKNSAISSMKTMEAKKLDLRFQIQSAWKKLKAQNQALSL